MQHELRAGSRWKRPTSAASAAICCSSWISPNPSTYVDPRAAEITTRPARNSPRWWTHNGGDSPLRVSQPIPYFEHVFPFMAGHDFPGESATQAIYSNEWQPYRYSLGETTSLADLDFPAYCARLTALRVTSPASGRISSPRSTPCRPSA